jgi:hypothetical protein
MYRERGHVDWSDNTPDRKRGTKMVTTLFELIAQ